MREREFFCGSLFFVGENLSAKKVGVQVMPEKMQVIEKPLQSPRKKGYN